MMDVIAGKVTFMFDITNTAIGFIRSGKARALAVTSRERNPQLPEVPTMIEAGLPNYEVMGWYALIAPPKLPETVSKKLITALKQILANADFRKTMAEGGYTLNDGDAKALQARIEKDYAMWSEVIERANTQPQ